MKRQVIKQNVGADLSKDDFKVAFYQQFIDKKMNTGSRIKATKTFKNTLSGFKKFVTWIEKHRDSNSEVRITMEATGVYYEQLVHYLKDSQTYHLSVVLPNKTKSYFKSLNLKSKTDKIDAKALGQMGLERDLEEWNPLSNNMLLLKQLTRSRSSLLDQKTAASNRLHALKHSYQPHKNVVKRIKSLMKFLTKQIKEVEQQIKEQIQSDESLRERVENVCTVSGLGITTVAIIVSETGGFKLFTSRSQLISFAGYDVVENESGTSIKGKTRISKKGNKYIRKAMHYPALTAVRHDANFKRIYDRIFDKTKIKMKGYVAVQRKLLILIYTLFKKNEAYNPNYLQELNTQKFELINT